MLTIASSRLIAAPPTYNTANDTQFLRFHGRGDVLRTAVPYSSCAAFPSGGVTNDMGEYMHVRMRVRLAPESEYAILDTNHAVTGGHTTGRVLWTQGIVRYSHYAGFTIGYGHDSPNDMGYLYLAVGDSGDTSDNEDGRSSVWQVEIILDDGEFHTIDWGYDESAPGTGQGKAYCWVDGTEQTVTEIPRYNGFEPDVKLNGTWSGGGAIMGNPNADALSKLANNGWGGAIGKANEVWPEPNGSDSGTNPAVSNPQNLLDTYTTALGDVAYAAFRWADPNSVLSGNNVWDVELKLNGSTTDDAGGLNSGDVSLLSPEDVGTIFDSSLVPEFVDSFSDTLITRWVPTTIDNQQARQFFVYHHGLGNQQISVNEYNGSTSSVEIISESIILCLEPDGKVGYFSGNTGQGYFRLVPNVPEYPAEGEHTFSLPAGKPGLYRILVKSGADEGFEFKTNQASPFWGVIAQFGPLEGVSALMSDAYAYIPRDVNPSSGDAFEVGTSAGTSLSERVFGATSGSTLSGSGQFNGLNTPGIIQASLDSNWSIESAGFPFVLSDDEFGTYHYIKGGVYEESSYTLWSLDEKILRDRIVKIVEREGFEDSDMIVNSFGDESTPGTFANHITSYPRDYFTLGTYPNSISEFNIAIHRQISSTGESMVGSVHHDENASSTRLEYGELPLSDNNVDLFGPSMLFWAGWDDVNANPYLNKDLDNRARAAMLAFGRHIQGGRLRRGNRFENDMNPGKAGLAGTDVLGIGMHWARVYDLFDTDDRAAFLPAALMQFCYVANDKPTTTRNQDTHHLPFLYEVGKLWETEKGSTKLNSWAKDYAQEIVEVPSPWSGENVALFEAQGFDGSYSGIQNYMITAGWIVSGDEFDPTDSGTGGDYNRDWDFLRDVLNRQYDFWSHYMGSSPDGSQIGFGHDNDSRQTQGAVHEQYGGAKMIGTLANDLAARLVLEDGHSSADDLLSNQWPGSLAVFPTDTATTQNWVGDPTVGTKLDLMPLYAGGFDHLFDAMGDPIDTGALFPSEVSVASGVVSVEEVDEGYIAVNTSCYYAIISTRESINEVYYEQAQPRHTIARDIENHSNTISGGGDHGSEDYTFLPGYSVSADKKKPNNSDELGGVGLSMFVDKTTPSGNMPLITGRNWSPLTTHQVIGYTVSGERRWVEQNTRSSNGSFDASGNYVLEICYDLNYDDTNVTFSHGYRVERVYTFKPDMIEVDVDVYLSGTVTDLSCGTISGTIEPLDRLVENIPFELDESVIGSSARSFRLAYLDSGFLPWGAHPQWDEWCASDWPNDGLRYTGQEIGWLQKEIVVPTTNNPKSSLSYTILPYYSTCSSSESLLANESSYMRVLDFVRAYEQNERSADVNRDGVVNALDIQDFVTQMMSDKE